MPLAIRQETDPAQPCRCLRCDWIGTRKDIGSWSSDRGWCPKCYNAFDNAGGPAIVELDIPKKKP